MRKKIGVTKKGISF